MFEFKHPKYYKNLRKLARLRNRDQAISPQAATAANGRTPGTGLTTLKKLVTKLNKDNEPPSGWRASDKIPSAQAEGGPTSVQAGKLHANNSARFVESAQAQEGRKPNKTR